MNPGMDKPYGVPPDFAEHFKLMTDMMHDRASRRT